VSANSVFRRGRLGLLVILVAALAGPAAAAPGGNGHGGGTGGGGRGGGDQYVALGDSYAAGPLIPNQIAPLGCLKSDHNYAHLAAPTIGLSLKDATCSGATTDDMTESQSTSLGSVPPQFDSLSAETTRVSLTIGGNDIGFADLIYQCTIGDCTTALESTTASLESTLGSSLDTVYSTIKTRAAAGATIIVLGYPHEFSGTTCVGTLGISAAEETDANALADALDNVIRTHAQNAGVTYQSAVSAFSGHEVCSSSPWLNGLNLFNTSESYHPNRDGHSFGYLPLVRTIVG
jgi:lysophospholipase L1-like esterase